MSATANSPVLDSVPKINEEVAVGEDLAFQRRWWLFERVIWSFFALVLVMTMLGCFGRGYFARTEGHSADNEIRAKYDRIQRTGTPSDITVVLGSQAVRDGQVHLFVSESLISKLGAQRISPQPERTYVGDKGLTYVFPALQPPVTVIFSVEPSGPGKFPFTLTVPDTQASLEAQVYVVP
ncbi:MAG: hypothetical protein ACRYFU_14915 [Janthinobacterium lividum]